MINHNNKLESIYHHFVSSIIIIDNKLVDQLSSLYIIRWPIIIIIHYQMINYHHYPLLDDQTQPKPSLDQFLPCFLSPVHWLLSLWAECKSQTNLCTERNNANFFAKGNKTIFAQRETRLVCKNVNLRFSRYCTRGERVHPLDLALSFTRHQSNCNGQAPCEQL